MKPISHSVGFFSLATVLLSISIPAVALPHSETDIVLRASNSSIELQARKEPEVNIEDNGPDGLPDGGRGPLILNDQWFRGPSGPWQYSDYGRQHLAH